MEHRSFTESIVEDAVPREALLPKLSYGKLRLKYAERIGEIV